MDGDFYGGAGYVSGGWNNYDAVWLRIKGLTAGF